MVRKLLTAGITTTLVAIGLSTSIPSAHAASLATATSVGLSDSADCGHADLDLGIISGDVDRELGTATSGGGTTLRAFEQPSTGLDGYDGVFVGYHIDLDSDQPDGTIIGSYAYLGTTPPSSATTAEWFVLYKCGADGTNQVLSTCFGDYGTCPRTAPEALNAMLRLTTSTTTPAPGKTVTAAGSGCPAAVGTVAAVSLVRAGTLVAIQYPITPADDGTFDATLTVPADIPAGTPLVLRAVCGDGDIAMSSVDVALTVTPTEAPEEVPGEAPTTTEPVGTTRPSFTG